MMEKKTILDRLIKLVAIFNRDREIPVQNTSKNLPNLTCQFGSFHEYKLNSETNAFIITVRI